VKKFTFLIVIVFILEGIGLLITIKNSREIKESVILQKTVKNFLWKEIGRIKKIGSFQGFKNVKMRIPPSFDYALYKKGVIEGKEKGAIKKYPCEIIIFVKDNYSGIEKIKFCEMRGYYKEGNILKTIAINFVLSKK